MITKDNFKEVLNKLGFADSGDSFTKEYKEIDTFLKVDFKKELLVYPEDKGLKVNERQTCNFSDTENFVVFKCINRLLEKGYKPEHLELEPRWKVGHGASGGRADIMIKYNSGKSLIIIECKTAGKEFDSLHNTFSPSLLCETSLSFRARYPQLLWPPRLNDAVGQVLTS